MRSKIFLSTIVHKRFFPFKHQFKYIVPSLFLNLNDEYSKIEIQNLKSKIDAQNKTNLTNFLVGGANLIIPLKLPVCNGAIYLISPLRYSERNIILF